MRGDICCLTDNRYFRAIADIGNNFQFGRSQTTSRPSKATFSKKCTTKLLRNIFVVICFQVKICRIMVRVAIALLWKRERD